MLSNYGLTLLNSYNYAATLPQSQFPNDQNYPGVGALIPALASYLSQAQTILETVANSASYPTTVSYGQIEVLVSSGNALALQLDNLNPSPTTFSAEVLDSVSALSNLLLYPELLSI